MTVLTSIAIKYIGLVYYLPSKIAERIDEMVKRRHCIVSDNAKLYISCKINNRQSKQAISIGRLSKLLCRLETYKHGGKISVGEYCFIGENTYIWSSGYIKIGHRVLISHGVNIHDTNSHAISARARHQHFIDIFQNGSPDTLDDVATRPIVIEDDAWIGFGAAIFKGVTIGKGAIVAAHSVVTKDVPAYTIVAGNPVRQIGQSLP